MSLLPFLGLFCLIPACIAQIRPSSGPPAPAPPAAGEAPIDVPALLLAVEANEKKLEALDRDYTYHVHSIERDLAGDGEVKKTTVTDAESLTIDGIRINRVIARNGRPLTEDERKGENDRVEKTLERDRARRSKLQNKGADVDERGHALLPASRILELGTFFHPRREFLAGRSTIVLDYAGDAHAKTRNAFEGVVRDLMGTVWIDEADRVLVRAHGEFRGDFKVGGGLLADVHKGTHFDFTTTRIADSIWLPAAIHAQGSARFLLFAGFNGEVEVTTSDYRRFRASATILPGNRVLGPDDQPIPTSGESQKGAPTTSVRTPTAPPR